ncbi:MAG: hypothetical protein DI605_05670 [Sphingomonas sp.]|nr:MAG: hypothetical protein DI605_05670 [Sphingomonas sp.]
MNDAKLRGAKPRAKRRPEELGLAERHMRQQCPAVTHRLDHADPEVGRQWQRSDPRAAGFVLWSVGAVIHRTVEEPDAIQSLRLFVRGRRSFDICQPPRPLPSKRFSGYGRYMAIANDRLSTLIGLIYDAAISPKAWEPALEAIRSALRAEIASVNLQAVPDGDVLLNVTSNIPAHYAEQMGDYGPEVIEIWGGATTMMSLPLDQPAILSRLNPAALDFGVTRNRYALEWARPQAVIDSLAIGLARDEKSLGSISFGRHRSVGPFDDAAIALARLLVPHLQRAATVNRLLEMSEVSRSNFTTVLDAIAVPIIIVGADMRIAHANPPARARFEARDILAERDGCLAAIDSGVHHALAGAIGQAVTQEERIARQGLGIPARRNDQSAAALYVMPLGGRLGAHRGRAAAAVLVAESGSRFIPSADLVTGLFNLTSAEGRVFDLLAAGNGLAEAAVILKVAPSTVKTHALRVYQKTGVSRQTELMQLAASFAVPF